MKFFLSGFIAFLLLACAPTSSAVTDGEVMTYWVDGMKAPCTGEAPRSCLRVKKGADFASGDWQNFYASIDGFAYETGYIYQLAVRETPIPADQVPADASSIKYTLVEVIDKKPDTKARLHDIWALEAINGEETDFTDESLRLSHPTIEFNLAEMRVFGTNGCNDFKGGLKTVTETQLEISPLASTRKACISPVIPNLVNAALNEVSAYELKGLKLRLLNADGREVLRYRKVD